MVFDKIKATLAEQLNIDPDTITRQTELMADLGADSLDLAELIVTLEEEHGISAPDDASFENKTVGDIVDYIETLLK